MSCNHGRKDGARSDRNRAAVPGFPSTLSSECIPELIAPMVAPDAAEQRRLVHALQSEQAEVREMASVFLATHPLAAETWGLIEALTSPDMIALHRPVVLCAAYVILESASCADVLRSALVRRLNGAQWREARALAFARGARRG